MEVLKENKTAELFLSVFGWIISLRGVGNLEIKKSELSLVVTLGMGLL